MRTSQPETPYGPKFWAALDKQGWTLEHYHSLCREYSDHREFKPPPAREWPVSPERRRELADMLRRAVADVELPVSDTPPPDARYAKTDAERANVEAKHTETLDWLKMRYDEEPVKGGPALARYLGGSGGPPSP